MNRGDGRYYEAHLPRFTSHQVANLAAGALTALGCNAARSQPDPDGDETVLITGAALDPSAILEHGRRILGTASGFMLVAPVINRMPLKDAQARHGGRRPPPPDAGSVASANASWSMALKLSSHAARAAVKPSPVSHDSEWLPGSVRPFSFGRRVGRMRVLPPRKSIAGRSPPAPARRLSP